MQHTTLEEPDTEASWSRWSDLEVVNSMLERQTPPPAAASAEGSVGQVSIYSNAVVRHDWSNALMMVERAARLIRDYEQKFVSIEREAREFLKRVDEDQGRMRQHIAALENKLAQTEERLKTANADNWDKKIRIQQLQKSLRDAEEEIGKSGDYIRKVEGLLGGL